MVNNLLSCFYFSLYRRISSITKIGLCVLYFYPQICMAMGGYEPQRMTSDILSDISDGNLDHLIKKFDELENAVQSFTDPLNQSRQFLQTFIEQTNAKFGLQLTIPEACSLIRKDLYTLGFPEEMENMILEIVTRFESDSQSSPGPAQNFEGISRSNTMGMNIHWPSWLLPDPCAKNHKKYHKNHEKNTPVTFSNSSLQLPNPGNELPGSVCAGGAEVLAGALICILGHIFPPAYGLGAGLIIDGISRAITGLDKLNKQHPHDSEQSSNPFDINF